MTMAWETTEDDVIVVLNAHNIEFDNDMVEKILSELDHDAIERGVLHFDNMEDQTASMLEDIEDYLIEQGIVTGDKQFLSVEDTDIIIE